MSSPDTRQPDLVICPANITTAAAGKVTNVTWSEPEFSELLGFQLNVTSTFSTNSTSLRWGEHRVEYTARNTYNDRETACVFYVEVTRKSLLKRKTRGGDTGYVSVFIYEIHVFTNLLVGQDRSIELPTLAKEDNARQLVKLQPPTVLKNNFLEVFVGSLNTNIYLFQTYKQIKQTNKKAMRTFPV